MLDLIYQFLIIAYLFTSLMSFEGVIKWRDTGNLRLLRVS